jgi:Cd2+/Zn2+-exporting ATPase
MWRNRDDARVLSASRSSHTLLRSVVARDDGRSSIEACAMKKLEMDLELVLPPGAGRVDPCCGRLMALLTGRRGVLEAHLEDGKERSSRLCIHFDPDMLPLRRLEGLVREAGAQLAEHYGHVDVAVSGLRHERHAHLVEDALANLPGVLQDRKSVV